MLARNLDKKRSSSRHRKLWRKEYESLGSTRQNRKKESQKYYLKNKDEILKRNKEYHKSIASKRKEYLSIWRKENKEKMREYYHKRKSLLLNATKNDLTSKQIEELYKLHPYCEYCGCKENLSLDHIVSLFKGGENSINNVTIACKSCNSSKGIKSLEEWTNVS